MDLFDQMELFLIYMFPSELRSALQVEAETLLAPLLQLGQGKTSGTQVPFQIRKTEMPQSLANFPNNGNCLGRRQYLYLQTLLHLCP